MSSKEVVPCDKIVESIIRSVYTGVKDMLNVDFLLTIDFDQTRRILVGVRLAWVYRFKERDMDDRMDCHGRRKVQTECQG